MVRRRWLASSGVVLGLLVAASSSGADEAEPENDEAAVVKAVEKLGGRVERDPERLGKPVVAVDLSGRKVPDAVLKELKKLKSLSDLTLTYTALTDTGIKEVKELKG